MTTSPDLSARLRPACNSCDETYSAWRWRYACGEPLDFTTGPTPSVATPNDADLDYRGDLWAFDGFLPTEPHTSLGEGMTPLIDAAEWEASFELEYVFPFGSFKGRGATTMFSLTSELGIERVAEDSSDNVGAAVTTYAARAGIDAEICVPASVELSKVRAIERAGARPIRIEGSRQTVTDAYVGAIEADDAWYASHAWNPAFFAGMVIVTYETTAQRDWLVPNVVIASLGHGTFFLGAYHDFRAFYETGWADWMPELYDAQVAGYSLIVDACHHTADGTNDVANGIQILDPVREAEIYEALDITGGDVIVLSADVVENELDWFYRHGLYTEPTCTVVSTVLRELHLSDVPDRDADVIVSLTGNDLKP